MLDIVSFLIRLGDQSCPSDCIWIFTFKMILSDLESFIKIVVMDVKDFGLLNHIISLSEAQDMPIWICSVKVENSVANKISV